MLNFINLFINFTIFIAAKNIIVIKFTINSAIIFLTFFINFINTTYSKNFINFITITIATEKNFIMSMTIIIIFMIHVVVMGICLNFKYTIINYFVNLIIY